VDGALPDVGGGVAAGRQHQLLVRVEPDGVDGARVALGGTDVMIFAKVVDKNWRKN
jgi:hypothetical protein